jgi:hypothetical protein
MDKPKLLSAIAEVIDQYRKAAQGVDDMIVKEGFMYCMEWGYTETKYQALYKIRKLEYLFETIKDDSLREAVDTITRFKDAMIDSFIETTLVQSSSSQASNRCSLLRREAEQELIKITKSWVRSASKLLK